jgi:rubredoxin-NAD+ reductase
VTKSQKKPEIPGILPPEPNNKKQLEVTSMKYVCDVCGWVYDEAEGYPEGGIAPGTPWEQVPEDFECPLCYVGKDQFSEE